MFVLGAVHVLAVLVWRFGWLADGPKVELADVGRELSPPLLKHLKPY
jgi:hypothetical protein